MIPTVHHEADTRNFSDKFTKLPALDLTCDAVVDEENRLFLGFSFIGVEALGDLPIRTRRSSSNGAPFEGGSAITQSIREISI